MVETLVAWISDTVEGALGGLVVYAEVVGIFFLSLGVAWFVGRVLRWLWGERW